MVDEVAQLLAPAEQQVVVDVDGSERGIRIAVHLRETGVDVVTAIQQLGDPMPLDGGVQSRDFLRAEQLPDDEVAVEVEEVALGFVHLSSSAGAR